MNVLITGGAGFIGSNLVDYLFNNTDYNIYIIDDLSTGNISNINHLTSTERVFFKRMSITSPEVIDYIKKISPKTIYHLAAKISVPLSFKNSSEYFKVNVMGTQNLLNAAKACNSKFLFSSSSSVYGEKNSISKETDLLNPISPYALTKKMGEDMCVFYNKVYGLETCCLRYFNVYGPKQSCNSPYSGVLSIFCNYKINNKTPTVFGDGKQRRDFTFVEDVAEINYLLSNKNLSGEIFNAAPGNSVSLNYILESLNFKNVNYKNIREGDIKFSHADSSKLKKYIKYTFKYDIDSGLKHYIKYLNDRKMEENKQSALYKGEERNSNLQDR